MWNVAVSSSYFDRYLLSTLFNSFYTKNGFWFNETVKRLNTSMILINAIFSIRKRCFMKSGLTYNQDITKLFVMTSGFSDILFVHI